MIQIPTAPSPAVLAENGDAWGNEYAAALNDGRRPLPRRYQDDSVRAALRSETHGKCAYCESHIEHVSYSHIEHIVPKSIAPLLVCAWDNLTLACEKCNKNKGAYHSVAAPLLNPYRDDVRSELSFDGPMAIDRSDRARLTIAKLKLNRASLLFRRYEALQAVVNILDLIKAFEDGSALREALREDLSDKLDSGAEYASCARFFVECEWPRRVAAEWTACDT